METPASAIRTLAAQSCSPDPFAPKVTVPQDIKQVWFAGVHADVGGGYPESESGISKFPLEWMIDEAKAAGLLTNELMIDHLVLGEMIPASPSGTELASRTSGWVVVTTLVLIFVPMPRAKSGCSRLTPTRAGAGTASLT